MILIRFWIMLKTESNTIHSVVDSRRRKLWKKKRDIHISFIRRVFVSCSIHSLCYRLVVDENRHCTQAHRFPSSNRSLIVFHLFSLTSLLPLLYRYSVAFLRVCDLFDCSFCFSFWMVFAELNARFVSSFYSLFVRSLNATVRFFLAHIFFVSISISHDVSHINRICMCVCACAHVYWCLCVLYMHAS